MDRQLENNEPAFKRDGFSYACAEIEKLVKNGHMRSIAMGDLQADQRKPNRILLVDTYGHETISALVSARGEGLVGEALLLKHLPPANRISHSRYDLSNFCIEVDEHSLHLLTGTDQRHFDHLVGKMEEPPFRFVAETVPMTPNQTQIFEHLQFLSRQGRMTVTENESGQIIGATTDRAAAKRLETLGCQVYQSPPTVTKGGTTSFSGNWNVNVAMGDQFGEGTLEGLLDSSVRIAEALAEAPRANTASVSRRI